MSHSEAREYCFIIMSYKPAYMAIFDHLKRQIEKHTGLRCVRADRSLEPGRDLLAKVHEMILGASVVVADVSEHSPNVYYEYGYASAHDRLPILIAESGSNLPTDLVGKETLRYQGAPAEDTDFLQKLMACIDQQLNSPLPEQRRMLTSPQPFPAYLMVSPRVPGAGSKHWWHPDERQTFGDMMGITGILTAYGNLFGTRRLPELLHAQCVPKDFFKSQANFFCLGSPKLNPATEHFLNVVQQNLSPQWKMPVLGEGDDPRVIIQGDPELDELLAVPVEEIDGTISDYGLLIRAPHPQNPQHLIMIAAGRHSIGTHAACLVAIRQDLIQMLEEKLGSNKRLQSVENPFWAIVRGTLLADGSCSDEVEILKVGGYERDV